MDEYKRTGAYKPVRVESKTSPGKQTSEIFKCLAIEYAEKEREQSPESSKKTTHSELEGTVSKLQKFVGKRPNKSGKTPKAAKKVRDKGIEKEHNEELSDVVVKMEPVEDPIN